MHISKGDVVMTYTLLPSQLRSLQLDAGKARPLATVSNLTSGQVQECHVTQGCVMQSSAGQHGDALLLQVQLYFRV